MSRKFYSIESKADSAEIMIYGEIGDSWFSESITARQLVSEIKNLENSHSRINVRINSPGGSVFDGLAIFNALQNSTAEIHTWNDGLAASMAALILMAGSTVHAASNSLMMLHSPSTGVYGNANDLKQALEVLDKVQASLIQCMLTRSEKTKDEIEKEYFDYKDHWLSSDEALEEGLIDDIVEKKANVNQKTAARNYQEMIEHFTETIPHGKRKNRLVAMFENLFSTGIEPVEPKTTALTQFQEMDIRLLAVALSLADTATESDVLASILKLKSDSTENKTALTAAKAENEKLKGDLEKAKADKATVDQELEDLRKEPGAPPAAIDPDPEPKDSDPKNFGDAFFSVMKTFKKK